MDEDDAGAARRMRATVKRFNPAKGFGFLVPDDGSGDVFFHVNIVGRDVEPELRPGAVVDCDVVRGAKGLQAMRIVVVDAAPAAAANREAWAREPSWSVEGRVKFYDAAKGFGFVVPDGGGKDVFVHAKTVERAGFAELVPDQRLRLRVRQGRKGPQAERLQEAPDGRDRGSQPD